MAERKIALVIGNGDYTYTARLSAPPRDARTMATKLQRIGFDVLPPGIDCEYHDFRRRTDDFLDRLSENTIALFFYSGHGAQAPDGSNHMIPVDTRLVDPRDFGRVTLPLNQLLADMRAKAEVSLLFLDACRDDPFSMGELGPPTKRIAIDRHGLSSVPVERLGQAMIAFAAEEGKVAYDRERDLSAFSEALAEHIMSPGADIRQVLDLVCRDVFTKSDGRQTPWTKNALHGPLILVPAPNVEETLAPEAGEEPAPDAEEVSAPKAGTLPTRDKDETEREQPFDPVRLWDRFRPFGKSIGLLGLAVALVGIAYAIYSPSPAPAQIRADRLLVSPNEPVQLEGLPQDAGLTLAWTVGDDEVIRSTSSRFTFSSTVPGEHDVHFSVSNIRRRSQSTTEVITVLESAQLDTAAVREVAGTRIYEYSGRELILDGVLLTNGEPIVIRAHTIRSNGAVIRAFPRPADPGAYGTMGSRGTNGQARGQPGSSGGDGWAGQTGADGAAAGDIRIEAERLFGTLTIDNSGQGAGEGGPGGTGGSGGNGAPGRSAVRGFPDCRSGPQDGGDGGAGGHAGPGGDGGDGGDAGTVQLVLTEIDDDAVLRITAQGGAPGIAGAAGRPGEGGSGAPRGSADGFQCRQTARNGTSGPEGQAAQDGAGGAPGADGIIEILIGDGTVRAAAGALGFP